MIKNVSPYKGNEKYVFISYAHRDSEIVLEIIKNLYDKNYRVWYDEGIDPGTEWDENISKHVEDCGYFIAFLSNNYIASSNCKDELNYARDLEKKRFLVYLEEVDLPSGMKMRLSRIQNVHMYKYADKNAFYDKLFSADGLNEFKSEAGEGMTLIKAEYSDDFVNISDLNNLSKKDASTTSNDSTGSVNSTTSTDFIILNGFLTKYMGSSSEVVIPNGVTSIGDNAFRGCKCVTSVNIPEGVTVIGNSAFRLCSELTSVTIPDSVTSIGSYAFMFCSKLANVKISNDLLLKSKTAFDESFFKKSTANSMRAKKPESNHNKEISKDFVIENGVLKKYNGTDSEVVIPDVVTKIGDNAFNGCRNLEAVTIPDSVTSIGSSAFMFCSKLKTIKIPNKVKNIAERAFYCCDNLIFVKIPDGVTSIDCEAFYSCENLPSITIPDSVTNVGIDAFSNCYALCSIYFSNSNATLGNRAFNSCSKLTNVHIPEALILKSETAFDESLYKKLNPAGFIVEDGVLKKYIGDASKVEIPNFVTKICANAFYHCFKLKSVNIPDSVTCIEDNAFYECSSLYEINVVESNANYSSCGGVLFNKNKTRLIKYPNYKSNFSYTIPDSVTSIAPAAFKRNLLIGSVTIPNSVKTIEKETFYGCEGLTNISIPDSVTSIGEEAFSNCKKICYIKLSENLKTIDKFAFFSCGAMTSITVPDSATSIGDGAFECCYHLKNVNISKDLLLKCKSAFSYKLYEQLINKR